MDEIQPFITLEKTVHIFRLLAENMNYFPDYDKDTEELSNQIAPNEYAKEYGNVYGCQYGQYGKSAICI